MCKTIIYYFSGSGNTYKAAIAAKSAMENRGLLCEIYSMDTVQGIEIGDATYLGLMFPVAVQSTYPLVWDFINRLPKVEGKSVFMIDTMQSFSGGIVGPLKKLLEAKGYNCVGALELKMTSSIQTKEMDRSLMIQKNDMALKTIDPFIEAVLEGRASWRRIPVLSDWMRGISKGRAIWTKTSTALSVDQGACVQCGVCIKSCPTQALCISDQTLEIDYDKCNACVRCVHKCPKDAFLWKGKKVIRI